LSPQEGQGVEQVRGVGVPGRVLLRGTEAAHLRERRLPLGFEVVVSSAQPLAERV
jgi:hypothetical protein